MKKGTWASGNMSRLKLIKRKCPACKGSGEGLIDPRSWYYSFPPKCKVCGGTGKIIG